MSARIFYINKPGSVIAHQQIDKEIDIFIRKEKAIRNLSTNFRYKIQYADGEGAGLKTAFITVYKPDPENLLGPWIQVGYYTSSESKRFEADIARMTASNPSGAIELSGNLLWNGMFNLSTPLDGWSITDDSTTGVASIVQNGNRLEITSTGTGTVVITSSKTTLTNLIQYATTLNIYSATAGSSVTLQIGSGSGSVRSAKGVYNEVVVSGGTEFSILFTITVPDSKIVLDYILLSAN